MLDKLIIGTAQFGLDYGISNNRGKIPISEAYKILDYLLECGVNKIDTATGYGDAEEVLGRYKRIKEFEITSKISYLSDFNIFKQVESSLERLNVNELNTLLIHDYESIPTLSERKIAIEKIKSVKKIGLCRNFGVSVYSPETTKLLDGSVVDSIQLPLNIFNQKFIETGELSRLISDGISIQLRSIFLQGFTLLDSIPSNLEFAKSEFIKYLDFIDDHKITKIDASIGFIKNNYMNSNIVVAVDSVNQIYELIDKFNSETNNIDYSILSSDNERLIMPNLW